MCQNKARLKTPRIPVCKTQQTQTPNPMPKPTKSCSLQMISLLTLGRLLFCPMTRLQLFLAKAQTETTIPRPSMPHLQYTYSPPRPILPATLATCSYPLFVLEYRWKQTPSPASSLIQYASTNLWVRANNVPNTINSLPETQGFLGFVIRHPFLARLCH
jgi:hypothetical protein